MVSETNNEDTENNEETEQNDKEVNEGVVNTETVMDDATEAILQTASLENFKEGTINFLRKFVIPFAFFGLLLYSFYSVSRGDFNDRPKKNYLLLLLCLAAPFAVMFVPFLWNLYTDILEDGSNTRVILMIFYFLFTFLYLIFFTMKANLLDNLVLKLKETFNFLIENFEENPTYFWLPIGITGIIAIIAFFIFSFKKTMSSDSSNTDKVVSLALGFGGFILFMIASIGLFKVFKKFNIFSNLSTWISANNSKAWTIFSLLVLSGAVPLFNVLDATDDNIFKEEKSKCDNPVEKDGSIKNDTKVEINDCKKKAHEKAYKGKIEFKKEPLIALVISLLMGFLVINRKEFIVFFEEDMLRNLLIAFVIVLIGFFYLFAFNSDEKNIDYMNEKDTKDEDGNINYENQRFKRTKTQYKIKDKIFLPITIVFLILGCIAFMGITLIVTKSDEYNRPNHYNLMEGFTWLFKNMSEPLKKMFLIGGVVSLIGLFIYFLTSSRTVLSGVTNLVFLSVALLTLTVIYKFATNLDIFRENIIFKLLINIVLFIPCLLFLIVEFLYNDIRETPKVVFAVLLGQIFLISSYFLTPIVLKYLSSYYTGKNRSNMYETESDLINLKIEELKNNFDLVKEKVEKITIKYTPAGEDKEKTENVDLIDKEKWGKLVIKARSGKEDIKKYFKDKSGLKQEHIDGLQKITKNPLDEDTESFIKTLTKTSYKKSENRYEQLVNFVYYFVNNKPLLQDGDSALLTASTGTIDRTAPNMQNINNRIDELELKKVNVNERKEIALLNKTTDLLDKPIYLEKEHIPIVKLNRRIKKGEGENAEVEIKEMEENARFQNLPTEMFREKSGDYSYNYGLSMWVFLHSQGTNYNEGYNKDTNILDYANNPKITYNPSNDKLKVKIAIDLPKCFGTSLANENTGWGKLDATDGTWNPVSNAFNCCFNNGTAKTPAWRSLNPFEWSKIIGKIDKDGNVIKDSLKKDNKIISIDDVKEELKQYLKVSDLRKNVFIKIKKDEKYEVRFIKSIDTSKEIIKYGKKEEEKNDPTEIHININNYLVEDGDNELDFVIENPSKVTKENYNLVKKWCKEDMTQNSIDNSNKLITIFEEEGLLKMQKWNNIVINYDLGVLDIFVNGELKGSYDSELQYIHDLPVKIGENEGLSGGICNVKYYPTSITKNQIELTYNALKLKNPPVI